jgi:predicted N-formylglutamate amidohydrolase
MAVEIIRGAQAPFVFIVDHAANDVPVDLASLGLPADELARHIAWDIGAANVARGLVARIGGVAVLSTISRLVIDCNRELDHPNLIPQFSDGTLIPANQNLTPLERQRRISAYYEPFHAALDHELSIDRVPVSVHSFTPVMEGFVRPWHIGLLYNMDDRMARWAIDWLRNNSDYVVGDNEPYSGKVLHATMNRHAEARRLPYFNFELRQNLIDNSIGIATWVDVLADLLRRAAQDHRF